MKELILASKSPYRKELLQRLGIPFKTQNSNVDEDAIKDQGIAPLELAKVLAKAKTKSVLQENPDAIVIGSDQLGHHNGEILGKPGTIDRAIDQLMSMQNSTHELITSVCVMSNEKTIEFTNITRLTMKSLSEQQIRNYLDKDQPFNCAGSYMIEKAGIALFEKVETDDFNAIVGLPLIELVKTLKEFEIDVFL